ncbi:unnamed protein product, partial [marine sediment metagenome]
SLGGTYDAFVGRVSDAGVLAWSSYLGGGNRDYGYGIAPDGAGGAFVTGETKSSDFPTSGGFDTTLGGDSDAFVARVSGAGALEWSSYLGGSIGGIADNSWDHGAAIASDGSGGAFVTGWTEAEDFPTPGGFDTTYNGNRDGFVASVSGAGALVWSSYLGGSGWEDEAQAIASDGAGGAFVAGFTGSEDFPTPGGFDTTLGGTRDAFVARVSGAGALEWASHLGGSDYDSGNGIVSDGVGGAFVTGFTWSSDFPTPGGFDTSLSGFSDA